MKEKDLSNEIVSNKQQDQPKTINPAGIHLGAAKIADQHAAVNARRNMHPKYSKSTREMLDNKKVRGKHLEQRMAGRKSIEDPYTGRKIHTSQNAAKRKYGKKWSKHALENDHIVSLKEIHEKTMRNPWINNDEISKIANQPQNLQPTNKSLNASKGQKTNEQFFGDKRNIKKHGITESGKKQALRDTKHAKAAIKRDIATTTAKNAVTQTGKAALSGAGQAALVGGGISIAMNAVSVIKGEKTPKDAIKDTAKQTGAAAATGGLVSGTQFFVSRQLSTSANTMLKSISSSNLPARAIVIGIEVATSLKRYADEEISTEELFIELGEKGFGLVGAELGALAGTAAGPVGMAIGGMVGYALASACYNGLVSTLQDERLTHEQRILIERDCAEAMSFMRLQREALNTVQDQYFSEIKTVYLTALMQMDKAYRANNAEAFIDGANQITTQAGDTALFSSMREFESLMANDEMIKL